MIKNHFLQASTAFFFACIIGQTFGQPMIISADEMQQSMNNPNSSSATFEALKTDDLTPGSSSIGKPNIEVISPDFNISIKSPAKVHLRFSSDPPATILPDTSKATYGAFKLDITDRLLLIAKPTSEGLIIDPANLPSGNHRINMEIQDSLGRKGIQVLSFRVQ